jgi:nitroreductase
MILTPRVKAAQCLKMVKGSEIRKADFPIERFLLDRWSPRAMSGEEISREELMRLFEAARWAPSSFNAQQWRALYARRGTEHWQTFFDLLVEAKGLGEECGGAGGVHLQKDI